MKLEFRVKLKYEQSMSLWVSGDLPELGGWDLEKALYLEFKGNDLWEATASITAPQNRKFEFKLVKKYYDGTVKWEVLPDNSNRKFRVGEDVQLTMEWSNREGRRKLLKRTSVKLSNLPSIIISGPAKKDTVTSAKYFNPFHDAENSDSGEEQAPEVKKEAAVRYDAKEFESIFYRLPKERINQCRMNSRLHTIYVVSRRQPSQSKFSAEVCGYLKNLRCQAVWIVEGPLVGKEKDGNIRYVPVYDTPAQQRKGMMKDFESKLQSTVPMFSICLIIDASLASLKLAGTVNGLLLGRLTLEETEQLKVADLAHIKCVSFTHIKQLKQFVEEVGDKTDTEQHRHLQNHIDEKLNVKMKEQGNEAIEFLLYELQQEVEITSPSKLRLPPPTNIKQLDKDLSERGSGLFIVDLNLLDKSREPKKLISKLIDISNLKGRFVVVLATRPREQVETDFPQLLQTKLVVVADDGVQVCMNHSWFNVLERHQRNIEIIKNKFREYIQCYGGSELQSLESKSYCNESPLIVQKVYREVKDMLNDEKYLRVSTNESSVSVSWKLKESRATLEAIVQLRCMVEGSIEFICAVIGDHKKECIFEDMDNLAKTFPMYFKQNLIRQYLIVGARPSENANGYLTTDQLQDFGFGLV